ncbi:hypothetical protein HQQ94_09410 [Shewanella sp. VB17]|uniref:hypothetical protein n=1 Tax=Shewanella sp. VB17 TaxID=2739432 RepID=UPI0015659895|nr:hypothetical protein [Shewanella sp. VB17]NRD73457.1 hypothetical protein [Shewanella sp. VB17]
MKLRPLVAWPFYNIPVITAFVNPFTSDATVEPTWIVLVACHRSVRTVLAGQALDINIA